MPTFWTIIIALLLGTVLLFALALCKVAQRADRQMEEFRHQREREWFN